MKKRFLLMLSFIFGITTLGFAQATRTITNADLEKYKEKREKAEAEYRATYKERGLPSPEELRQREVERQKYLSEYAQRAEQERIARENVQAQIQYEMNLRRNNNGGQNVVVYNQQPGYTGGQILYPYGYGRGWYQRNPRVVFQPVQPHTQLSPLLPNVQINTTPTRIFTTPNNYPRRIYSTPPRRIGGRGSRGN